MADPGLAIRQLIIQIVESQIYSLSLFIPIQKLILHRKMQTHRLRENFKMQCFLFDKLFSTFKRSLIK